MTTPYPRIGPYLILGEKSVKWRILLRARCRFCGNVKLVRKQNAQIAKSCGCMTNDLLRMFNTTHGHTSNRSVSSTYNSWRGMFPRCYSKTDPAYHNYGERSIKICRRWRSSFMNFLKDMGEKAHNRMTLGRINNDGDYEPSNCRWETYKTQANNRRTNKVLRYKGETHTLKEWSEKLNLPYKKLVGRIYNGWSATRAFTT